MKPQANGKMLALGQGTLEKRLEKGESEVIRVLLRGLSELHEVVSLTHGDVNKMPVFHKYDLRFHELLDFIHSEYPDLNLEPYTGIYDGIMKPVYRIAGLKQNSDYLDTRLSSLRTESEIGVVRYPLLIFDSQDAQNKDSGDSAKVNGKRQLEKPKKRNNQVHGSQLTRIKDLKDLLEGAYLNSDGNEESPRAQELYVALREERERLREIGIDVSEYEGTARELCGDLNSFDNIIKRGDQRKSLR